MSGRPRRPLPDSYWVEPERLAAGEYPGHPFPDEIAEKLEPFTAVGIDLFVDLTEEGEYGLEPYAPHLPAGIEHRRMPIRDMHVPTREEMRAILDLIDGALAAGRRVYVHCFGGIGRTGTVVGCWLVRHGTPPEEALVRIAEWRRGTPDASRSSPETPAQRELVRAWGGASSRGGGRRGGRTVYVAAASVWRAAVRAVSTSASPIS